MLKAISTHLFPDIPLSGRLLDHIASSGFEGVEIDVARMHFDYRDRTQVREIAGWFASSELHPHSLHAPLTSSLEADSPHAVVSIAFQERQRRQDSMDEIRRALEVAESIPIPFLVLPLGIAGDRFDLRKFDAALTSLEHLRLFAGQRGVEILLENMASDLASPARLLEFAAHAHLKDLRFCLDTGHAHLDGEVKPAIEMLGATIQMAHLNDNAGVRDQHLFPGEGDIDWTECLRALAGHAPNIAWVLEARAAGDISSRLDQARNAISLLERTIEEDPA